MNIDKEINDAVKHKRELMQQFKNPKDDSKSVVTKEIWEAFGWYIRKNLLNGKMIRVPKFGNFTFTFPNHVNMPGATNPDVRDPQIRTPVFVVSKDFVSGVTVSPGIVGSLNHDMHVAPSETDTVFSNQTRRSVRPRNQLVPFKAQDEVGIIPKHEISYLEIAMLTGNVNTSKAMVKEHCECAMRTLSDKVRAGKAIKSEIPYVGSLLVRGGLAGVIFDPELV